MVYGWGSECLIWFFTTHQQSFSYVGQIFLGWTSTKLGQMCLAQGLQGSDACEARTRAPSVSSQALYHWATVLPFYEVNRVGHAGGTPVGISQSVLLNVLLNKKHEYIWYRGGDLNGFWDISDLKNWLALGMLESGISNFKLSCKTIYQYLSHQKIQNNPFRG